MLHYLIDGYNLLYAMPQLPGGTWQEKRTQLLEWLLKDRPYGRNVVTVVFDNKKGMGGSDTFAELGIVFTDHETADEWISRRVRQTLNPRVMVVVTDDMGLRRQIQGTGAKWMGATEFTTVSQAMTAAPAPSAAQMRKENPPANDTITQEFRKKWLS